MSVGLWLVVGLLTACGKAGLEQRVKPNLVLIIADDQGYGDFGFMGSTSIETPHLDELAAQGTVFPFGYTTASVCRPALQTLLTGMYPHQWTRRVADLRARGVRHQPRTYIQEIQTLPRLLSANGYATFQGGKYWEGTYEMGGFTHGMTKLLSSGTTGELGGGPSLRLARDTMKPVFDFIDEHADGPFFVWFAPALPHAPFNAPWKFWQLYAEMRRPARGYYANITRFDDAVGQLLDYMDDRGLTASTLVAFVSDNGWEAKPASTRAQKHFFGGARGKLSLYELGFRTPVVLRWPGHVAAGSTMDALVSIVDLMPTLLDYAGIAIPADVAGRSLRPLVDGRVEKIREAVVGHMDRVRRDTPRGEWLPGNRGGYFVRTRQWYYVWYRADDRDELFDMESDPDQKNDVVELHPEVVKRLRRAIREWESDTGGAG